ncbi:MAG: GNAT family N-acetyltransferase, partial [Vicinamibacterales bacterium]
VRAERVRAPRPPALRGRIVASLDDVGLDGEAWNALAARSDTRSVFQTYEWTRSWLATIGDQYQPWFVTVADGSGVRGVAPLVVEARGSGERIVRFLGDGRADYLDLLAGDGEPLVVDAMFDALREHGRWDVIELNNIPGHSRTAPVLRDICAAAGYRMLADDQYPCPTLVIEGHEEEARRIANKPSLRRRTNYFNRSGRLVCRNLGTARDIEPYLEAFFDQHVTRWGGNGQGNSSLFVDPRNRSFYRELTRRMTGRGWLLFSVVEFNDRPIAFHYGFDYNGSVIWYKPSFDVAFEHHSPGIVMVRHLIGYALDQKRRELDFTVGDEPFKRRFTNDVRKTVRVRVFRDQARYYWECSKRELVGAVRKLAR